ncbi:MAG: TIGR01777 family oxidoreductase [Bdellovibrionota bacterium]|nr:TIGR01777 family oxidoreductase [Bdellovibrionota bacterium]
MRILIAGATGFVGQFLCHSLTKGHEVYALTRSVEKAKDIIPGTTPVHWPDINSSFELPHTHFDVVINLLGENIAGGRWTEERKKALFDSRITGTKNLFKQLKSAQVDCYIQSSAVGFFGNTGDNLVTEDSVAGEGFLAKICQSWEGEALMHQDQYKRSAILRFGVVLGPNGGALDKMLPAFKLGIAGRLGDGKQYMPWIHVDDIVRIVEKLISDKSTQGIFNVVAPERVTNTEFTKTLGRVLGRPTILPAPEFAIKLALGEMSQVLLEGQNVEPEHLRHIGYEFKYPKLKEALDSVVS